MLTHTERTGQSGRYFAINRDVFPDFARVTINLAPTFCADRTEEDASDSNIFIGTDWCARSCWNTAAESMYASASRQISAMHDTASNG